MNREIGRITRNMAKNLSRLHNSSLRPQLQDLLKELAGSNIAETATISTTTGCSPEPSLCGSAENILVSEQVTKAEKSSPLKTLIGKRYHAEGNECIKMDYDGGGKKRQYQTRLQKRLDREKRISSRRKRELFDVRDIPMFCTCQDVEYGLMAKCDNIECPIGWYHFKCAGISHEPKGTWICHICRSVRRKQRANKSFYT